MSDEEEWIRDHVEPTGPAVPVKVRPWATTLRVLIKDGCVYFKACAPVQAFEVRLTAQLAARWPGRVPDVIAHDEERAWLLLADAGEPLGFDAPIEPWFEVLPRYAELQRGETQHAADHVAHGTPDLHLDVLPERYEAMVAGDLPLDATELARVRSFTPRLAQLCGELAAREIPESIQHDDLHGGNVYGRRVLDWGDSSVAHPFFSLVTTFRLVAEDDRLRDAYLEPWGPGHEETFALALRIGWCAHAVAWTRQRAHLPEHEHPDFDIGYLQILRRVLAGAVE